MSRHSRWSLAALVAAGAIIVSACGGSATPSPATPAPATPAPATPAPATPAPATPAPATPAPATPAPPVGLAYPEAGDAACGDAKNTSEIKRIKAVDPATVEFDLCGSDAAFLSKIAFTDFGINDTAYLEKAVADGSIVSQPNGTGPYMVKEWVKGDHITLAANPNYWGPNKPKVATVIVKWSTEAAQRLVELQSGNVDGIDNVGPSDFDTVKGDPTLQLLPRQALNVMYLGFNNTKPPFDNEKVRQAIAQGIDRQRIVDNFYPTGSEVADYFTPCAIPGGCEGDKWYTFDKVAAKKLLADAGFPNGFKTSIHLRDVNRSYISNQKQVAQDIQAQLKANLNIDATIDVQESTTFLDNAKNGALDGIHILGWGADYPDITDFLDYHFGAGASKQFGNKFDDLTAALKKGASSADPTARLADAAEANNLIKQHVPMIPVAHGGSAVAFKADVAGAHTSPLGDEYFAVMQPADRQQLVWLQNGEPGGLYCADEEDGESIRVCNQVVESLYTYKIGGVDPQPNLAKECTANADLSVWTCALQTGVKFGDGSDFDANDVVMSYAVQWDAANPLHKGRTGSFTYFSALFGGFLNPPPAQ